MTTLTLGDFSIRSLSNQTSSLQASPVNRKVQDFGVLKKRASSSGEVTVSKSDRYLFTLKRTAKVKVTLLNTSDADRIGLFGDTKARVQAALFDDFDDELNSTSRIKPQEEESFIRRLTAGDYTLKLTGRSKDPIQYTIQLRAN
jgi:hypothetical protein